MVTHWTAVWQMAAKRHSTMQGEDHLSQHAHDVLEQLAINEARDALFAAHGQVSFYLFQ